MHEIKYIKVEQLNLLEGNPRFITKERFEKLKESIANNPDYFEARPCLVNDASGKLVVYAGNQRLRAGIAIGLAEVPCIVETLEPKKEKERTIRDNIELGAWDMDLLANNWNIEELKDWGVENVDFGINNEGLTDENAIPDTPEEPKTKPGYLYFLGDHRLMCGDSTNIQHVEGLMDGEKADMVFTDPPYGVDYSGKNEMLNKFNKGNHVQTDIVNDSIEDYKQFFRDFLSIIPMADYNTCFISMSGQQLHNLRLAFEEAGFYWSDYLIWAKNNHVLGRKDYNAKHEFIMYGWKTHHKFYGPSGTTLLEYNRPLKSDLHPTMKPIDLIQRLITDGSQQGFIVYDCFGGSGSTLIACEKTKRKCRMMEISPEYCDVIVKRWEEYTGAKATQGQA